MEIKLNNLFQRSKKLLLIFVILNLLSFYGIYYYYNNSVGNVTEYSIKPRALNFLNFVDIFNNPNVHYNFFYCPMEIPPYQYLLIKNKEVDCIDDTSGKPYNFPFHTFHSDNQIEKFHIDMLNFQDALDLNDINEYFKNKNNFFYNTEEIYRILKNAKVILKKDKYKTPIQILIRYKYSSKVNIKDINKYFFTKTKDLFISSMSSYLAIKISKANHLESEINSFLNEYNLQNIMKIKTEKYIFIEFLESLRDTINIKKDNVTDNKKNLLSAIDLYGKFNESVKKHNISINFTDPQVFFIIMSDILDRVYYDSEVLDELIEYLKSPAYESFVSSMINNIAFDMKKVQTQINYNRIALKRLELIQISDINRLSQISFFNRNINLLPYKEISISSFFSAALLVFNLFLILILFIFSVFKLNKIK